MAGPALDILILSRRSKEGGKSSSAAQRGRMPDDDLGLLVDQIDQDIEELKRRRARSYFGLDLSRFHLQTVAHPDDVAGHLGQRSFAFVFLYRLEGLPERLAALLSRRRRLASPPVLVVAYNDQERKGGRWFDWSRSDRYLSPATGRDMIEGKRLDRLLRQIYLDLAEQCGVIFTSVQQQEALLQMTLHLWSSLDDVRTRPPLVYEPSGEIVLPDDPLKIPRKLFDPAVPFLDARTLAIQFGLVQGGLIDRAKGLFRRR